MKDLKAFYNIIKYPLILVASIWVVELMERYFFGVPLTRYGIYPRSLNGLEGVILAPFIHGDWQHIISNTSPLLVLGAIMYAFYTRVASVSIALIWVITGFFVWLFARPSHHIGASGIVYGLVGFVLASGIFRKDNLSIILSLIVLILYGGFAQGLLPKEGMSHESHIIGALAGIFIANLFKNVDNDSKDTKPTLSREPRKRIFRPDMFERTMIEHRLNDYFMNHQRVEKWRRKNQPPSS